MTEIERRVRKPLRLPGYDYSTPSWYMVTICVHHMEPRFGVVRDGEMILNTGGEIADRRWRGLVHGSQVDLDTYVIMPNHIYGIIVLRDSETGSRLTLGQVVASYKSQVMAEYTDCVRAEMFPLYDRSLWQRGLQDRIIRNDHMLDTWHTYIEGNPGRWTEKYG